MMKDIQPLFNIRAEHGESPVWDEIGGMFYWVDLLKGQFHKASLHTGNLETFEVGQPLGVLALRERGGYVLAIKEGFAFYDDGTKKLTLINDPEAHLPETRFNDGAIDPAGRFLAGTMEFNGSRPIGSLYSLSSDLQVSQLETSIYITNGMDWNPAGDSFFLTDTNRHLIYKYNYDVETGEIKDRNVFIAFDENEFPDGMCIDAEGSLWVAMWNGGKISRFDSEGKKIGDILLPVQYPTSCCFGGEDLSRLLITTSTLLLNEKEKNANPLSGRILSIETDTRGQYMRKFKG
jgi:D-xylonolactonase